jgi:hypothetical protein
MTTSSLTVLLPDASGIPTTRFTDFDVLVTQDAQRPCFTPKRGRFDNDVWLEMWQGEEKKAPNTYRSIRQERYDFESSRHSGSFEPRWDLMHLRYESMMCLHSPGMRC